MSTQSKKRFELSYEKFEEGLKFLSLKLNSFKDTIPALENTQIANIFPINITISRKEVYKEVKNIEQLYFCDNFIFLSSNEYEIAVHKQNRINFMDKYRPVKEFQASHQDNTFTLSTASNRYIFAFICFLSTQPDIRFGVEFLRYIARKEKNITLIQELNNLFDIRTVKLKKSNQNNQGFVSNIKQLTESYLFNIAFNDGVIFKIIDFSNIINNTVPKNNRNGSLYPFKYQNQELVQYYYQGLLADAPLTQYLNFFHVAEFFFQTISEEDVYTMITNSITFPTFSPYNKDSIRDLYKNIRSKIKKQREDGVWEEKTGLLLCLKKYITNIVELRDLIETIDSSAIEHYKTTVVPFTNDSTVIDFTPQGNDIYEKIRDRVYSVRNAIVHSKDGERLRYEPFKHDEALSKEIPLIRAIAEIIINNSSTKIEL